MILKLHYKLKKGIYILPLSFILLTSFSLTPNVNAESNCSVNVYPQPTPGTHRYTVTLTNNTSNPIYHFVNNFWVDGNASGNPSNISTTPDNYWDLSWGLGYSVSGRAGVPILQGESISYETELTFSSSFDGIDLGVAGKDSNGYNICNQPHGTYPVTYNNLNLSPTPTVPPTPTPIPITPANCSLNIYPQPTPGTHRYTVTLTNNTTVPGYNFTNNFWVDGVPSGHPGNTSTLSNWYIHSPLLVLPYNVTGTAGTPISQGDSVTYETDLTFGNSFNGVDISLQSIYKGFAICSQGHDSYTITYNNPNPNSSPTVENLDITTNPVLVNSQINANATFTDTDASDTHTAEWDWGDGSTTSGSISENNGSGSVTGTHTYSFSGIYMITLTVTDDHGSQGTRTYQYLSVYSPTPQGLFSAGQRYTSPAGAYTQLPDITGNVLFGLSYKYQGTVPVGTRQFGLDFNQANLHFNATSVSSLVIENNMGTLTGTGTINDTGNYSFLVTGNETANTVRIQIKDQIGNIIYDTQPGDSATATPTTVVTGNVLAH